MKTEAENPNRTVANLAGAEGAAKREATFDELPPEQQIQRLRMELIMQRELVNSQQMLIDRLMVHVHNANGDMLVPMRSSGVSGMLAGSRRDPLR